MEFSYSEQQLIEVARRQEAKAKEARKSAERSRASREKAEADRIRERDAKRENVMLAAEKKIEQAKASQEDLRLRAKKVIERFARDLTDFGARVSVSTWGFQNERDLLTIVDDRTGVAVTVAVSSAGFRVK